MPLHYAASGKIPLGYRDASIKDNNVHSYLSLISFFEVNWQVTDLEKNIQGLMGMCMNEWVS